MLDCKAVSRSHSVPLETPLAIGVLQMVMAVVENPETQLATEATEATEENGQHRHPNYGSVPVALTR